MWSAAPGQPGRGDLAGEERGRDTATLQSVSFGLVQQLWGFSQEAPLPWVGWVQRPSMGGLWVAPQGF